MGKSQARYDERVGEPLNPIRRTTVQQFRQGRRRSSLSAFHQIEIHKLYGEQQTVRAALLAY